MVVYRDITFTLNLDEISEEEYNKILLTISKMGGVTGDLETLTYDENFDEAEAPF